MCVKILAIINYIISSTLDNHNDNHALIMFNNLLIYIKFLPSHWLTDWNLHNYFLCQLQPHMCISYSVDFLKYVLPPGFKVTPVYQSKTGKTVVGLTGYYTVSSIVCNNILQIILPGETKSVTLILPLATTVTCMYIVFYIYM